MQLHLPPLLGYNCWNVGKAGEVLVHQCADSKISDQETSPSGLILAQCRRKDPPGRTSDPAQHRLMLGSGRKFQNSGNTPLTAVGTPYLRAGDRHNRVGALGSMALPVALGSASLHAGLSRSAGLKPIPRLSRPVWAPKKGLQRVHARIGEWLAWHYPSLAGPH